MDTNVTPGVAGGPIEEDPAGRRFERLISSLEKAIAPDAKVEHNIKLQNIVTGRFEQIDVLITQGKPPRESRAIVEVQDRSRPVEINEFRGWVQKRIETGVEQLIVVSKHDFPQSIIDDVRLRHGPCIKLLTFKDVEQCNWPFEFHLGEFRLMRTEHLKPYHSSAILTEPDLPNSRVSIGGKAFEREGGADRRTLEELAEEGLLTQDMESVNAPGEHDHQVLISAQPPLWLHVGDRRYLVKFMIASYRCRRTGVKMPLSVAKYEQLDYRGEPTWVATCTGHVEGKPITVRMFVVSDAQGLFKQYKCEIDGFEQVFGKVESLSLLMAEFPQFSSFDESIH